VADSTANTDTALGTPLGLTLEEAAALVTANFSLFAVRLRLAKMASELRSGDAARPCSLLRVAFKRMLVARVKRSTRSFAFHLHLSGEIKHNQRQMSNLIYS